MAETMTLYNIAPFFAITGILSLVFGIPILRFLDNAPAMHSHRESNVDGLRGYLALAVFIYHSVIYYTYLTEGRWGMPPHLFYGPLGGVGVAFFSMITGFLFWGKLLKNNGEPAWRELYIGRVFRIGPMYIFTVLIMMFIIFQRSNFEVRQPAGDLLDVSIRWLALGLNADSPIFNGFPWTPFILLGVTWSIKYEWWFYFSLILTSVFVRLGMQRSFVTVGLAASIGLLLNSDNVLWALPACFFIGMLVATLLRDDVRPRCNDQIASIIVIACLTVFFTFFHTHAGLLQLILLGVSFYLICAKASLFGILRTKGAHRLGHISYSIYLMQGLPLTVIFNNPKIVHWSTASPERYWLSIFGIAMLLTLAAAATYALIERPGIELGKKCAALLASRQIWQKDATAGDPTS